MDISKVGSFSEPRKKLFGRRTLKILERGKELDCKRNKTLDFSEVEDFTNPREFPPPTLHDNWIPFNPYEIIYRPTEQPENNPSSQKVDETPYFTSKSTSFSTSEYDKFKGTTVVGIFTKSKKALKKRSKQNEVSKKQKKNTKASYEHPVAMKDIILALVTRVLFGSHALVAIWRAYTEYNQITMWLLLVPVGLLILEALFTVGARGGEEYKWISPCVFLYLASVVPSIWFLELKNFDRRQDRHICNDLHWGFASQPGCLKRFQYAQLNADIEVVLGNVTLRKTACEEEYALLTTAEKNQTIVATTTMELLATTRADVGDAIGNVIGTLDQGKKALDNLLQNINFFNEQTWILVLHQLLLFFLIVGRWLLPTGEGISRDQLSQLLLVFIGVGADILEFVTETIKEIEVRCDKLLLIIIMSFWSWSTLQFSLVLTASKARRTRAVGIYEGEDENESPVVVVEEEEKPGRCMQFWKNMEVWGIFSTLILQDGPFLATRLYIMVGRGVVHQMIVFFTTKNALVVILQLYRLSIIGLHKPKEEDEDEEGYGVAALGALQGAVIGGVNPKDYVESNKEEDNGSIDKLEMEKQDSRSFTPEEFGDDTKNDIIITTVDESVRNSSANNSNGMKRGVAFVNTR